MIIQNGTMQAVCMTGGGFDNSGNPIAVTKQLSEPIPVNISGSMARDTHTASGTSYTSATYKILCDDTSFSAEDIRLVNGRGTNLGVFRVKDIQYLEYVDAVEIVAERYGEE